MKKTLLLLAAVIGLYGFSKGQNNENQKNKEGIDLGLGGIRLSGVCFISYYDQKKDIDDSNTLHTNAFTLRRGYITLKKDLTKNLSVRYTQDITVDKEGKDAGNVETRIKYLYLKVKLNPNISWLTGTYMEIGAVHRPWIDYEQRINNYRVQGLMASDRNRIFISADMGITLAGNIGGKMDSGFLKTHGKSMQGKYCSYAVGVYDGGGYSGLERNNNKIFASRLTFRPLAKYAPELQVSGIVNLGKGNREEEPEFSQYMGMLAWTGRQLTLTAQAGQGRGDSRGLYVDKDDPSKALNNYGYSFFGEYKIKNSNWAVWGRYDSFTIERENTDDETERLMGGISYRINKSVRTSFDVEHDNHNDLVTNAVKVNLELKF